MTGIDRVLKSLESEWKTQKRKKKEFSSGVD